LYSFHAEEQRDTKALNVQKQQEMREYNDQTRRIKKCTRRYGRCGKTGHYIKTYNIDLESSEEQDSDLLN
jgi:hypothetical protein